MGDTKLSLNLVSETVEQILDRRKKMLRETCDNLGWEFLKNCPPEFAAFLKELMEAACHAGPLAHDAESLNVNSTYKDAFTKIVDLKDRSGTPAACLAVQLCQSWRRCGAASETRGLVDSLCTGLTLTS